MLPVLKRAAEGETRVPDVASQFADEFGLTQGERDQLLPSGKQRVLSNRIHWAKFYMSKAGLIESPRRGHFIATEAGRKLLAQDPAKIDIARLLEYPRFKEFYLGSGEHAEDVVASGAPAPQPAVTTTPEEQIEVAYSELSSALRADILLTAHQPEQPGLLRAGDRRSSRCYGVWGIPA